MWLLLKASLIVHGHCSLLCQASYSLASLFRHLWHNGYRRRSRGGGEQGSGVQRGDVVRHDRRSDHQHRTIQLEDEQMVRSSNASDLPRLLCRRSHVGNGQDHLSVAPQGLLCSTKLIQGPVQI